MNSKVCDDQSRDESPDARLVILHNAIQEGLDSGHAEFFDFDEFVMLKLSQAGIYALLDEVHHSI